jgi:predicted HTH domain antitoxin
VLIELQDELLRGLELTEGQARLDLAIGLFIDRRVTLGRGAIVAGLTQSDFLRELGRRSVPIHYDVEDLRADVQTLAGLKKS